MTLELQHEDLLVDDDLQPTSEPGPGDGDTASTDGAVRVPILPLVFPASGRYVVDAIAVPLLAPPATARLALPVEPLLPFKRREELCLDVDGRYPQMVASGTVSVGLWAQVHWIAELAAAGRNTWTGTITYTDGAAFLLPYTNVKIKAVRSPLAILRRLTVTFSAVGKVNRVRSYRYASASYHPVELEFDTVQGTTAVTTFDTGSHPNRPAGLPVENLSIETVYRRAGFAVTTGTNSIVPMAAAGADALWSDMEMHDAMQVHWARFANRAQWATWALFAGQHVAVPSQGITPTNLGGIMFDDIGPNHRQGTAIFNNSFIGTPPAGDPNAPAAVRRIKFWTAVHELGHSFNLAHSWQKSLGTQWVPLADEPEGRTFMNYPYRVTGGAPAFFADFEYRFSDDELLFLRHAPSRFVQPGNAAWFDHHGFEGAAVSPSPQLSLELRVHRQEGARFEFLEPVVVELKLSNVSARACVIDANVLAHTDDMSVIIKRQGGPARQWIPYARYCLDAEPQILEPGKALYRTLPIGAGINGWDIAEPGHYDVQVALHLDSEDVVSEPLHVRIAPPQSRAEEYVAQDVFTDEVGRVLTFNGSRSLTGAIEALQNASALLPDRRIATHAQVALGNALARPYKRLEVGADRRDVSIVLEAAEPHAAAVHLSAALQAKPEVAADTLGHIDYTQHVIDQAAFLAEQGEQEVAAACLDEAEALLSRRGVLPEVVAEVAGERSRYAGERSTRGKRSAPKR